MVNCDVTFVFLISHTLCFLSFFMLLLAEGVLFVLCMFIFPLLATAVAFGFYNHIRPTRTKRESSALALAIFYTE